MYDLAVAITGTGDISYENAKALLGDFLNDKSLAIVLNDSYSEGQANVRRALHDMTILCNYAPDEHIIRDLEETEAREKAVFLLGEGKIEHSELLRYKTYDLSKGLFMVNSSVSCLPGSTPTEYPLDGCQIDANGLTVSAEPRVRTRNPIALVGSQAHAGNSGDDSQDIGNSGLTVRFPPEVSSYFTEKEIIDLVMSHIHMNETGFHPEPAELTKAFDEAEEASIEHLTKYYKSKTGKLRKAGKSKARPGETVVYINPEGEENVNTEG